MPIQHAIWTVGSQPTALQPSRLLNEKCLEDMILADPRILSGEWMLIGHQVTTSHKDRIDLLAMAPDGSLVLIELKRDRTPREVIAQALDYASWVEELTAEQIAQIFRRFTEGRVTLDDAFRARFGTTLDEETLNQSHQIILVASELDARTERIINYLNARDIPINAVFFQVFQHGEQQLLSRAWLIDPGETQINVATSTQSRIKGEKEAWNGEYYVSYGSPRSWKDAREYGFISGGGGTWYSQTLRMLSLGDRVWVKIPQTGYVGVGRVTSTALPVKDFTVRTPQGDQPALDVLEQAGNMSVDADDPEKAEYFVGVEWTDTVPESAAINEVGLFGNQNTVCQPTTPKWRHTVDRLKTHFTKWEGEG